MSKRASARSPRARATVAWGFVEGLLSGLAARGDDPAPLLERAGVVASVRGRNQRVTIGQYELLYNGVVGHLADEGFALFERPVPPGAFEFLCRGTLSSATLAEALDRASRYLRMVVPDLAIEVQRGATGQPGAELRIAETRPLQADRADPRRVFALEWMLRLLHALACWLVARDLPFAAVRFPYPEPAHAADYALIYSERSSFDADLLAAELPAHFLELPVRRDENALAVFLEGAPGRIVALYRRDREMARQVRELVARALPDPLRLADVAHRLNRSSRTVERRLHEEGSSLRAIKDALRRDLALARLEKSDLPVAQIAAALGYADTSAFFRAFTAWTGLAPSAWRARSRKTP
jgi:AraC-like DNA-binding protein